MKPIRLVSWKEEEGRAKERRLGELGYQVIYEAADAGKLLKILKEDRPEALIIDLSRSPAQGRDLGVALRVRASTRHIPLVFAGGAEEKVERVKSVLPDAEFTSWELVGVALQRALTNPPASPVVPDSALAGYSGTPLPKKLGIKPSSKVLLAGAPPDFSDILGALPEGATLVNRFSEDVDLILWFVRSGQELKRDVGKWYSRVGKDGIWILWPKRSSGVASDLQQSLVRRAGLDAGLVDYKIAAVDAVWSGLKFAVRQ
jgi:hypothetical protein